MRHRLPGGVVLVLTCFGLVAADARGQGQRASSDSSLFADAPAMAMAQAEELTDAEPGVLRRRATRIRFTALAEPGAPARVKGRGRNRIELNLFPDATYTAVLDGELVPTLHGFAWVGHVEDIDGSYVSLAAVGNALAGTVLLPDATYRIRATLAGAHVIEEMDPSAVPPDSEPIGPRGGPLAAAATTGVLTGQAADSGSAIDVLVVYNQAAEDGAGGPSGIQALIDQAIVDTNVALNNSRVTPRVWLAHAAKLSYTQASSLATDLTRLQGESDGFLDAVHALRDLYRADLVQLLVGNVTGGLCGLANQLGGGDGAEFERQAFSVVARSCVGSPFLSFGHELAHNMGCAHAPGDTGPSGAYSYSRGYRNPQNLFRTMMAYDCTPSCPRVLHYSNPDPAALYLGYPTGTSTQNNAATIQNKRSLVANFRGSNRVYEGYHDTATCRDIYGWAWDMNDPNTPISVDIFRDGTRVTTVLANRFRQDLVNAGKGNGYHGFQYTPNLGWRDSNWHSTRVRFSSTTTSLSTTPRDIICEVPIFTSQQPTEPSNDTGGTVYTVATQFSSSHGGMITHVRFWRALGETGSNTIKIWNDQGTQVLGQVTYSDDIHQGNWIFWLPLDQPVPITAGTRYRVSVNTNTKQAKSGCGIGSGITNRTLTAHQGFWIAGNQFPTNASCSNFFVDVRFDL